jgi:Fic-DOC domain mobile mystery protein B
MGLNLNYRKGQTPLDEDEKEGLLIPTIATREELDEFEQQNIEEVIQWTLSKSFRPEIVFSEKFVCNLHKRMFGNVWSWAGKFRNTNKNIGVGKWQIPVALQSLCDDALFWVANQTYPPDEIAIRFKHRIVSIHCFPNGNGRHSRLMADLLVSKIYHDPVFSWGSGELVQSGDTRTAYLSALRLADKGELQPLVAFARS